MTFKSKTYSVDLVATSGPDERVAAVIKALPEAEAQLGERPTHLMIDKGLRINVEPLLELGLKIYRQRVAWVSRYLVRLAVEEPEVVEVPGGPRRLTVSGRNGSSGAALSSGAGMEFPALRGEGG